MELELPFAYTAVMMEDETFLGAASTLPQLIDLLRERQSEWQERQEDSEESQLAYAALIEGLIGAHDVYWSDLSGLAIRAHVNGVHSIDVDMKIYLGEAGVDVIRQGSKHQQFLEAEHIPLHWPTVEQQLEIIAQFREG